MYRCTPIPTKVYCVDCDLSNKNTIDDIKQLAESGDIVILTDDIEEVIEMFPNLEVEEI